MSEREHIRQSENNNSNVALINNDENSSCLINLFTIKFFNGPLQNVLDQLDLESIFVLMQVNKYFNNFIGNLDQYWQKIIDTIEYDQIKKCLFKCIQIINKEYDGDEQNDLVYNNDFAKIYSFLTGSKNLFIFNQNYCHLYFLFHQVSINNRIEKEISAHHTVEGKKYSIMDFIKRKEYIKNLVIYDQRFFKVIKFFKFQQDYCYLLDQMFIIFNKKNVEIHFEFKNFNLEITYKKVAIIEFLEDDTIRTTEISKPRSILVNEILEKLTILDTDKNHLYTESSIKLFFEKLLNCFYETINNF